MSNATACDFCGKVAASGTRSAIGGLPAGVVSIEFNSTPACDTYIIKADCCEACQKKSISVLLDEYNNRRMYNVLGEVAP